MSKKLTFDEMYNIAKKIDFWWIMPRGIKEILDQSLCNYYGTVSKMDVTITSEPYHILVNYRGVELGKLGDENKKLKRLRSQIYKEAHSKDKQKDSVTRDKGRSLARKLLRE